MVMKRLTLILLILAPVTAFSDLRIFSCEPEWAALAIEIGAEHVDTYSATHALQDPHYIQARPSLIAKVRRADLVVCSGADLEIGWLPMLLSKANNRDVMPGKPGYMEVSLLVPRLDIPQDIDRAQGDMHPQGNPHVQMNPHNISIIAGFLAERMAQLDAGNAVIYAAGLDDFLQRWKKAIMAWEERAAPLRGLSVIPHHKSWVYLQDWLGLEEVATLEPVAGIPPTAMHLSALLKQLGDDGTGANFIIRAPFQSAKTSEWLSERTGIPARMLPLTVGGTDDANSLFHLFDDILARLQGENS
jgi:zinc/manganese transport system substrate-binding protein